MKKYLLILAALVALTSCKEAEVAKAIPFTFNKPGQSPIAPTLGTSMTLLSAASPSFVATPTVQVSGVVSGETILVYSDAGCGTLVGSMVASATTVIITTSPLMVGTYSFYTRTSNQFATSVCSSALLPYQYLGIAPTTASSMTLQSPASSPSSVATPTILLSGVVLGERNFLYIDAACTVSYGSAIATGTTVAVTSDRLPPGASQFYTKSSNTAGIGTCSTALLSYTYTGVAPTTASSLTLSDPLSSPNYDATPTFQAAGVANGDTVKIYTDSGCTTMVGSSVVGNASVVLVTSSTLAVAVYNFYTKSTNTIGTSACSPLRATYEYVGPAPTVRVSWTANHEKSVNMAGGGYKIYYSTSPGVSTTTGTPINVPYVSGATAPVTYDFTNLSMGMTYFKVVAYSTTLSSKSAASDEFSISLP